MNLHRHAAEDHQRFAPVDLRLHTGRVDLRDEHLLDREAHRTLARADVLTDRRLRDIRAVLIHQTPVDPPRGVPLLARRGPIFLKPPIDHRPIRAELRRWATHRRPLRGRHRRRQRLLHRPTMNPMPDRERPQRQTLPITVSSDLLELLHPGSHSLWRLPLELDEPRTVSRPSDTRWSQFKPSQRSHFRASFRAPGSFRGEAVLGQPARLPDAPSCRVGPTPFDAGPPSEPDVHLSMHPAQAGRGDLSIGLSTDPRPLGRGSSAGPLTTTDGRASSLSVG